KNLLQPHMPYVPGESAIDSDLREGLDLVLAEIGYDARQRRRGRGVGIAIGLKDSGGVNKPAQAQVKTTTTGGVILNCGAVEIGQGIQTALARIAAEILDCAPERVAYAPINTDVTAFDQGTNASSAIVVMGKAVERAARDCVRQILDFAAGALKADAKDLRLHDWAIVKGNESHPLAPLIMRHFGGTGFEFVGRGYFKADIDHHAPLETQCVSWEIGWGAAEVEVDEETGRLTVNKLVVSGDAGKAIQKDVCRGQDEGAAVMALGQALFEHMSYDGPMLTNMSAAKYRVPLASDLPAEFVSITQEQGRGPGPFGAKGMGEAGILPVAAAIANAVDDAIGVRITSLPITPEKIYAALEAKKKT
ncbi:MAG: xanthine dehydrogenase family protein molybdopterin-binding subunit, partial [Solimonas sp.]